MLLQSRLPAFDWRGLAVGVVKCAVASGLMGVALYFFVYFSGAPEAIAPRVIQLAIALALGSLRFARKDIGV